MENTWLYRVDDRLIHGQVCVGWAETLGIPHMLLVDDEIAESDFEREIYACCPGPEQSLHFLSVNEMAARSQQDPLGTTLVVLSSLEAMEALLDAGAKVACVTLGGLHHCDEAKEYRDALFLTEAQVECAKRLINRGLDLVYQPLPGQTPEKVAAILK